MIGVDIVDGPSDVPTATWILSTLDFANGP
jgi:hypothetical protein